MTERVTERVMSRDYQCHVTINNRSNKFLRKMNDELKWGEFLEGPVDQIGPKMLTKAFVAAGKLATPSGTEGTVTYQLGDDANVQIRIYWDVPWRPGTSNTVTATATNPDVSAAVSGLNGSGPVEAVQIQIVDGR